jgi:ABC-type glycerol-3-phosphate transport system substrate-binding protein
MTLGRRGLMGAAAAASLARPAIAQGKPEKLVFVGDTGPWHWSLREDVAPAFEKEHGIKVEFTLLPIDALNARLKAELTSGSGGIDIVQWTAIWAGWLSPYMEDHAAWLKKASGPSSVDYDWDDFLPATKQMASYEGKLGGIPYRATMGVLHYQKPVLEAAGFAKAPESWDEFLAAAVATNRMGAPDRAGYGILGRQGPAIVGNYTPFLFSNGGDHFDPKTMAIHINEPKAVEALEFFGDLMTRYKVIPQDALTWEFDEIVANGQNDRYAMSITLGPYGSLLNDAKLSRTGGRWTAAVVPGRHGRGESRTFVGGWTLGVPTSTKNKEWAFEFIQMATSKKWHRQSMERGNAPTRSSVLLDPVMVEKFTWAPAAAEALKTARLDPAHPIWPTLEVSLRGGISAVLLGQKTAKVALDGVASDWTRSLKRANLIK